MMSQHSQPGCDDSNGCWLPLIEYSIRSGLSLSTIRRKIKSNSLQYRMENGKYLIFFEDEAKTAPRQTAPSSPLLNKGKWEVQPAGEEQREALKERRDEKGDNGKAASSAIESAVRMVSEAFEHALREKDERIHLLEKSNRSLQEQLDELRLLVKVLEEKYEVRY